MAKPIKKNKTTEGSFSPSATSIFFCFTGGSEAGTSVISISSFFSLKI